MNTVRFKTSREATHSTSTNISWWSGHSGAGKITAGKPALSAAMQYEAIIKSMTAEISHLKKKQAREKIDRRKKMAAAIIQAEERERAHLGHELHDNVNQVLTTARLYLDMVNPSDEQGAEMVEKTKAFIHNAINEIRCISKELVLPHLDGKPLTGKIQELANDLAATGLYSIRFSHKDMEGIQLTEGKKTTLFRIVQEQVKNIIRHSGASHICIDLRHRRGHVILTIKDDGIGFDATVKPKGIGLSNIHNRVQLYEGTVKIITAPGKGCVLQTSLPVES